jgi:hypothetical protein
MVAAGKISVFAVAPSNQWHRMLSSATRPPTVTAGPPDFS